MSDVSLKRSLERWSGPWGTLCTAHADGWMWLDTMEGGLHHGPNLPEMQPAGLTHVWGWRDDGSVLVRIRADRDLPDGFVGARLVIAEPGDPDAVDVTVTRCSTWPTTAGQISPQGSYASLLGGQLEATIAMRKCAESPTQTTIVPLTFLRLLRTGGATGRPTAAPHGVVAGEGGSARE